MKSKKRRSSTKLNQRKSQPDTPASAQINVKIGLSSARVAETVYRSILPETVKTAGFRSRTSLRRNGRVLELVIKARDVVALRAASNSFLRFLGVALKTIDVVAPFYSARQADVNLKAGR